jgi:putative aldouronate transport system substrate-binding protein
MNTGKTPRILVLALVLVVALATLVSCAQPTAAPTNNATPTTEQLKQVELNFYLLGPEPKDMASVSAELDKLSTADMKATVKWTFLGWDKWDQKYTLALSSGEPIDAIYVASWANYLTYAKSGAYMALDDLLAANAPESVKQVTEDAWKQTKVGGKIYCVPCDWKEYTTDCTTYRADIAKSLGIEKIETVADLETFFDAVKAQDPTALPFNGTAVDMSGFQGYFYKGLTSLGNRLFILEDDATGKLVNFFETANFKEYATTMKRWADKGFWSKSILSNQIIAEELFKQGKNVACQSNPTKADTLYRNTRADHPDWEIGVLTYAEINGKATTTPSYRNGMALPKNSPNPERALMYIDKLRYDARYYNLTEYGIQGKHYVIDTEGNYVAAASDTGFSYMGMQPWGWHVTKMELPTKGGWPGFDAVYEKLDKIYVFDRYASFAFDKTPVSGEEAAITQVINEFFYPIYAGRVDDVDAAIAKGIDELKKAGYEKYLAEVQKQRDAYLAEQG